MYTVLILGAKGNLGGELVDIFSSDHNVVAWDREEIDITDRDLVIKKAGDIQPDIIINAAAYNDVDKCEQDEKEYESARKINSEAPGYLADAALSQKAVLVHYSSDYVFDGSRQEGYEESSETSPVSKYGKTKADGEKEVIKRSGQGLKWYLIRTSKLFGPKGENENAKPSFFDLILKLSAERDSFNMVHQEEVSCFTYTTDLAAATKALWEGKKPYGIYHITNSEAVSWYDAAKYLFELARVEGVKLNPVSSADYPRPAKRPNYSILLNTKLKPMRSWRSALQDYLVRYNKI